jgi:pyruvate dehydrogenase E2 component (dihydrolipoamide acetyltransferase)
MAVMELLMPKLGHLQEVGTVVEWVKKPGEAVRKGEILMVVDTEKTSVEVEAAFTGQLLDTIVETGETVPVNTPIAHYAAEEDV